MKYIPVFHPFGVALRSKSVPDGFVTMYFTKKRNNLVYCRLSKMRCGFKDQVRTRPSGEKCGLTRFPLIHSYGYGYFGLPALRPAGQPVGCSNLLPANFSVGDRPTCFTNLPLNSKSFIQYAGQLTVGCFL